MDMDNMDLSKLDASQRDTIMSTVKQQVAIANATAILTELSDKCMTKCITRPGTSLDGSEKQCLTRCADRFLETWNQVAQSYQNRLQHENSTGGLGGYR